MLANIQEADKTHLQDWLLLRNLMWSDCPESEHLEEMQSYIDHQDKTALVALAKDQTLIGFIEISTRGIAEGCSTAPVAYIEGWYVFKDYRAQGVGKQLVESAKSWAKDQGFKEIASDVELTNEISRQAHLSMGFEEHDHLVHFVHTL